MPLVLGATAAASAFPWVVQLEPQPDMATLRSQLQTSFPDGLGVINVAAMVEESHCSPFSPQQLVWQVARLSPAHQLAKADAWTL